MRITVAAAGNNHSSFVYRLKDYVSRICLAWRLKVSLRIALRSSIAAVALERDSGFIAIHCTHDAQRSAQEQ